MVSDEARYHSGYAGAWEEEGGDMKRLRGAFKYYDFTPWGRSKILEKREDHYIKKS